MPWGHFLTIVAQSVIVAVLAVIVLAAVIGIGDSINKRK